MFSASTWMDICMTMYLWQILELLAYFTNYWLGKGNLVKGLSLLVCMFVYSHKLWGYVRTWLRTICVLNYFAN